MNDLIRTHAALLCVGFVTYVMMGAGQSLYGPALPAFSRIFAVAEGEVGYLVSAHWVGCFLGVGVMYLRGAWVTPRHCLVAMALRAGLIATLAAWWVTLLGATIFGLGYGFATAVFNPRVLRAFGAKGPSMLSFLNATFALGAIAAPLVFVAFGSDPRWSFGLTAGLAALIWLGAGAAGRAEAAPAGAVRAFRTNGRSWALARWRSGWRLASSALAPPA